MKLLLLIIVAAAIVAALIICQLKKLAEKHPNAEMLIRFYQMIC